MCVFLGLCGLVVGAKRFLVEGFVFDSQLGQGVSLDQVLHVYDHFWCHMKQYPLL